ncbi:hypothetical protein [Chelativorans intermedius]|uniref:Uncharacterized protein n=1 Tax=Chelativorans intermedius TaxID=515947 RepID=A0ABV6D9R8_9HYPH|nr:hypothetical protein [Chelativorans intermedius]MCT8999114.1 hypothetical protein [Chelativorans intermedius]
MNDFRAKALAHLKRHWHVSIAGTADASHLLNINSNTLKTRLNRGQALVMREPAGPVRSALSFTGYHLIYNLIADRLFRYGLGAEQIDVEEGGLPHIYATWAHDFILSPPHRDESTVRFVKEVDDRVTHMLFEDGKADDWPDAAMTLPLGYMVTRLAGSLYARSGHDEIVNEMLANVKALSEDI